MMRDIEQGGKASYEPENDAEGENFQEDMSVDGKKLLLSIQRQTHVFSESPVMK